MRGCDGAIPTSCLPIRSEGRPIDGLEGALPCGGSWKRDMPSPVRLSPPRHARYAPRIKEALRSPSGFGKIRFVCLGHRKALAFGTGGNHVDA
ncbi:hypothetical protein HMPREF0762_01597 [Slackia exigua ATCC 700122]|uniref:Uncharacterized protein n=1 Tax=Slackia exigua (strain ATCC 700122 / DSM 15923 / CIP 105133 / JCM 11022 / KCTC 5966 / S-7) TaxID=649764 RepID=D0WIC2_SLAES|nr:hypothetical protein HMPREF0762_01597 [Slackia exigua ATCC 700122]